jgi:hypothetical protein
MTKWYLEPCADGHEVYKETDRHRRSYRGVAKGSLFAALVWLADTLMPGDLVHTPEGWSARHQAWRFNSTPS